VLVTSALRDGPLGNRFDVIVVGAGAAGSALAAALSDDASCSVLVVEAGRYFGSVDRYPELLQRVDDFSFSLAPGQTYPRHPRYGSFTWSYEGHLNEFRRARIVRGRVVGGSSAINGASFTRGLPQDYERWAAAGNTEWSFDRVLPSLRAIETDLDFGDTELHGARGPMLVRRGTEQDLSPSSMIFAQAALDAGFDWDPDLNGLSTGGVGLMPRNVVAGVRLNAGAAFLGRVMPRRNLSLVDRCVVHRVVVHDGRAIGVELDHQGSLHRIHADEVVLCAGGINSPHLLMLSGIGPTEMLGHAGIAPHVRLDHVGSGLADHPYVVVPFTVAPDLQDVGGGASVCLNYASASGGREDLTIVAYPSRPKVHDSDAPNALGLYCGLQAPLNRGEIVLRAASPRSSPIVHYNYLVHEDDRRRMRECVRLGVDLLEHPEYRSVGARQTALAPSQLADDSELDRWIATNLCTAYHSAGTCKMGPDSDESAVVDQYGRVRGVEGLRIVDASIVPTLTTRGMHANAVLMGEHAASLMRSAQPGLVREVDKSC